MAALVNAPAEERRAYRAFEELVGGREKLVEHLQAAAETPEQETLVRLLADPENDRRSLPTIADMAGLRFGQVMKFFIEAGFAQAHMEAFRRVWTGLPDVAEDVMARAVPHLVECPACLGTGEVSETKKVGKGKDAQVVETTKQCWECKGQKQVTRQPDLERQKLALEMGRMIQGKAGVQVGVGVGIGVGVQAGQFGGVLPPELLRNLRTASDRVLYREDRRPSPPPAAEAVVDAEVVEVQPPVED